MSKQDSQHVGGPIPDGLFQPINLYSIAKEIPKTEILRDSLAGWTSRENIDISDLVREVSLMCQNDWIRKKHKNERYEDDKDAFQRHIENWRAELASKRVSKYLIDKIISAVHI